MIVTIFSIKVRVGKERTNGFGWILVACGAEQLHWPPHQPTLLQLRQMQSKAAE